MLHCSQQRASLPVGAGYVVYSGFISACLLKTDADCFLETEFQGETEVYSKCAAKEAKKACRDVELFIHHSFTVLVVRASHLHVSESFSIQLLKL